MKTDPDDVLANLRAHTGYYFGEGLNHEGQPFRGEFVLEALVDERGLSILFVASGSNGQVFHKEHSTIAPSIEGRLSLWSLNSNTPSLLQHDLVRSMPEQGAQATYVFGFGDIKNQNSFREEVAIDLFENGDVGYRYSWGLPNAEFAPRSGLRLKKKLSSSLRRPDFIKHWSDVLSPDSSTYPGSDELLSFGAPLGKATGLQKIGVHHEILKPGRRTSWPHAESHEEEFVYVVSGYPSAWVNGHLYPLRPGDAVGFPAGTGISHTFINNSEADAILLVVGERNKDENKCIYPLHPKRNEEIGDFLWRDCPTQEMGSHDGLPDRQRKPKK